jgi:hypothetical protein
MIAAVFCWLLGALIVGAICRAEASAQVVDANATCNGVSGQTYSNICYAGGNVLRGATNSYVIYYVSWDSSTQAIINTWLANIGGTGLFGINTAYLDFSGAAVQNIVHYNGATNSYQDYQTPGDDYLKLGTTLNGDAAIQTIVSDAINSGHFPADQGGVYFVLTASNVTQINSPFGTFCSNYIAYHSASTTIVPGTSIKYALVGDPSPCPGFDGNFINGDNTTPNASVAADGTINLIFHELSEAVTDPWGGSWGPTSPQANESGDMCEWEFGNWSKLPLAADGARTTT